MNLSIVIPAYNEAKRIKSTLVDINSFMERTYKESLSYEILIVIDGATDNTLGVVQELQKKIKYITIINNRKNKGKGGVVKQGMLKAKGEVVLFMDADNSTNISHIQKMLPFFQQGYDVVIGSRDLPESKIDVHQAKYKEIMGDMGNRFIQVMAVPGVKDTQCGFKMFSSTAVKKIFPKVTIFGWAFDVEVLAIARHYGFKIKEVGVSWKNDNRSNVRMSAYFEVLIDTVKVRFNLMKRIYS